MFCSLTSASADLCGVAILADILVGVCDVFAGNLDSNLADNLAYNLGCNLGKYT
jgi:hypothetical protein